MSKKDIKQERVDKSLAKRQALKELEEHLEKLDIWQRDDWSIMQDLALDVEATYSIKNEKLSLDKLKVEMKKEAKIRYEEYEGLPEKIIAAIPSKQAMTKWRKNKKWSPAIWEKCKETGLFSKEKKALMIQALFDKGMEKGDVNAIKTWLTISGDFVEKQEVTSKEHDIYREINEALHRKKN